MIFAIAGRKESGKSTLSKVLIDLGFKKISFADKLKKLVADLYEFPLEDCYETLAKEKKISILFGMKKQHKDCVV